MLRTISHITSAVALVAGIALLSASAHAADALTMERAIDAALHANPGLAASAQQAQAAHARPPQAATPPDPNFMVQFGQVPINTADVSKGTTTYMVQQTIPFPGKLIYGYKAEKRAAEAATSHVAMTAQEVTRQVKLAYLDVYRLQEESRIERHARSAFGVGKASAEQAYAADEGTLSDPLRAAVDMGDVEGRLATIEQERLDALAQLAALMAAPLDPETSVAKPTAVARVASARALIDRAKAASPDIKETQHLIRAQDARVAQAKSEYGPDLTLRWGYDDRYNQQDAWTGRVMVSVPLWSLSKQRYSVRESKALAKHARSLNEERVLGIEAAVKSAHARYMAATKRVDIYGHKVVPRAQTFLKASTEAYQAGSEDFATVTDAIMSLRKAETELVHARVDQQRAYADLERAVGAPPTKEGS